jgi:hypothetical protein
LVKVGPTKVGEETYTAVTVKTAKGQVDLLVPNLKRSGRAYPDRLLLTAAKKLKVGETIEYRTRTEDGKTLLTMVRKAKPLPPATKGKGKGKGPRRGKEGRAKGGGVE